MYKYPPGITVACLLVTLSSKKCFQWKKMWLLQLVTQTIIQALFLLTPLHLGCSRLILYVIPILSQKILKRLNKIQGLHKINSFYCFTKVILKWKWHFFFHEDTVMINTVTTVQFDAPSLIHAKVPSVWLIITLVQLLHVLTRKSQVTSQDYH